ncbi:MAG TPA: hypothetical protein VKB67_15385 [Rhizomicrobium sp.]|nr:hypothetical protein [Rhizomicrobium sp.]
MRNLFDDFVMFLAVTAILALVEVFHLVEIENANTAPHSGLTETVPATPSMRPRLIEAPGKYRHREFFK